eukprot:jgi/Mesvir1/21034/Mv08082-RA.1
MARRCCRRKTRRLLGVGAVLATLVVVFCTVDLKLFRASEEAVSVPEDEPELELEEGASEEPVKSRAKVNEELLHAFRREDNHGYVVASGGPSSHGKGAAPVPPAARAAAEPASSPATLSDDSIADEDVSGDITEDVAAESSSESSPSASSPSADSASGAAANKAAKRGKKGANKPGSKGAEKGAEDAPSDGSGPELEDCLTADTTAAQKLLQTWMNSVSKELPGKDEAFRKAIMCTRKAFLSRLKDRFLVRLHRHFLERHKGSLDNAKEGQKRYHTAFWILDRELRLPNNARFHACGCRELISHDFVGPETSVVVEPVRVLAGRFPEGVVPPGKYYLSPTCHSWVGGKAPAAGPGPAPLPPQAKTLQRAEAWTPGTEDTGVDIIQQAVSLKPSFCPFAIKECVEPDRPGQGLHLLKSQDKRVEDTFVPAGVDAVRRDQWEKLPSVPPHSWGTCAIVASGDSVLDAEYGPDIDAHDTVVRVGHMPFDDDSHRRPSDVRKDYTKFVGSRTDVLVTKRRPMNPSWRHADARFMIDTYGPADVNASSSAKVLHLWEHDKPPVVAEYSPQGGPRVLGYLLYDKMTSPLTADDISRVKRFEEFGKNVWAGRRRKPSTGFLLALDVIFSGFCTRVDLYGFTTNCGWHYWPRRARPMSILHSCELESWVLHHLMKAHEQDLKTCIYV